MTGPAYNSGQASLGSRLADTGGKNTKAMVPDLADFVGSATKDLFKDVTMTPWSSEQTNMLASKGGGDFGWLSGLANAFAKTGLDLKDKWAAHNQVGAGMVAPVDGGHHDALSEALHNHGVPAHVDTPMGGAAQQDQPLFSPASYDTMAGFAGAKPNTSTTANNGGDDWTSLAYPSTSFPKVGDIAEVYKGDLGTFAPSRGAGAGRGKDGPAGVSVGG